MHTERTTINEVSLLLRNWLVDAPKSTILLVHGYGEHSGRYEETASILNDAGYSVYSYDRRGEGASDGQKGHIQSIHNHVKDLIEVRKKIVVKGKLFLMAHSLGGLISLTYLLDHRPTDLSGVVLSSPFVKIDDGTAPILQKLAGIVSTLFPKLPTTTLDVNLISRDPLVVRDYVDDPLVYHGKINAKTGYEMIKAIRHVQSKFTKEISILDGLYHETMREPEKEKFYTRVTTWLQARS